MKNMELINLILQISVAQRQLVVRDADCLSTGVHRIHHRAKHDSRTFKQLEKPTRERERKRERELMSTATLGGAMSIVNGGGGAQRTVLITGVSRGLGKALALEMAKLGHTVIGCSRSQDKLNSLQAELSSSSSSAQPPNSNPSSSDKHLFMTVDVSSNSSVEELVHAVVEKKGVPDIIVNNAGAINRNNRIWEVPVEEFDAVIDTNIKGIANVLRNFIPHMIEKKQGIIVNMSSGWGRSAAAQVAPYCASKWAVEGLTRSVAKELPTGMAIVALNPGVINTEMLASCFGSSAALYQSPESWAPKAATMILNLTAADNGAALTV